MDATMLIDHLLESHAPLNALTEPLPDDVAAVVVERLKQEADRHWWINANRSLELAEMIVQIGQARDDMAHIALGTMARGDALKLLGRSPEAWEALDQAGQLFLDVGDEVGWARTRIGRLFICVDLNQVPVALHDAERARAIFIEHNVPDKLLVLDSNTAAVHNYLGNHAQALVLFHQGLAIAQSLESNGDKYFVPLYTNIGFAHEALGDFRTALTFHQQARAVAEERIEMRSLAVAETNIAIIKMRQGQYREALNLLHRAQTLYSEENLARDSAEVQRTMVECYLHLNRYGEARELAQQVAAKFREFGESYEEAVTLLELAVADAELGDLDAARISLDAAEPTFESLGAHAWLATTQLRRGQVAFQHGDIATTQHEAMLASAWFEASGHQVNHATALLLQGRAFLAVNKLFEAMDVTTVALRIAQQCNVPSLRYTAHLLLGRIAEAQNHLSYAARRYKAAASVVDRVQRGLSITLRPGFLEDKGEALQALLGLQLRRGQGQRAFETLERTKSQVLLNYLTNREHLQWRENDPHTRQLTDELSQLRAEHQWFYELAHNQLHSDDKRPTNVSQQQALQELAVRERQIRSLTERLYLTSGDNTAARRTHSPTLDDVRHQLPEDSVLIEFYHDGQQLWAFTVDRNSLQVVPLQTQGALVDQLLSQFQMNVNAALQAGPESATARGFTRLGQRILQRLYDALLAPLRSRIQHTQRLVVVPYGALHYLPFHLLHDGTNYVIDKREVVVLPTAGLATTQSPARTGGARVLAHSWNGRLAHTAIEAQVVQQLMGGAIYDEHKARRTALSAQPTQVLHIAAHGEHRLDSPDLSYIQLADGQLYTDDLLQLDLSYELVTLSACETGRANVAAGDELIGLGRGFLYAGAGALVASMWPVVDNTAVALMEHMYRGLCAGMSKAAALRETQRLQYHAQPQLHPAFWGAFQLIGDARPLSNSPNATELREHMHEFQTAITTTQ